MLALVCYFNPTFAKDGTQDAPSMAFLEYLADLEQFDGQWLSPMDMGAQQQLLESAMLDVIPQDQGEALKSATEKHADRPRAEQLSKKSEIKEMKK
jgi:hypothetical protein